MHIKTLLIGYGNRDRQDDGAGWYILARVAEKFGLQVPEYPGEWAETPDGSLCLLYLYQLLPEMAEELVAYQRVIFIDAHNSPQMPDVSFEDVKPAWEHSAFTHHMAAEELLSITNTLFSSCPEAKMLSVRGYAFAFDRELSGETQSLADQAACLLEAELKLLNEKDA